MKTDLNEAGTNRAIDFGKVRKRRQRMTMLKRILLLVCVMLVIGIILFMNQVFLDERLTTTLSDFAESFGGSGFPVDLPGGVIRDVGSLGKNLTVLNDTNLYIYSQKGKIAKNIQKMTGNGVSITSDSRLLAFSIGGREFSVHSFSRELYKGSLEFGILCGALNGHGDFALVSQVKQFASKTIVYDRHFNEIYSWSSPEYVTGVALSPNGDMMAASCVSSENGRLEALIYTFDFSEEKEQEEIALKLYESIVLGVGYPEDDRVTVLTDRQYLVLNSSGEKKHAYDFGEDQILAAEHRERQTLLLFRTGDGKKYKLVLLDASLKEKAAAELTSEVKDIAFGSDAVYALSSAGIGVYDMNFKLKYKFNKRNISRIQIADTKLYYLTNTEICALSQSELAVVPAKSGSTAAQQLGEKLKNGLSGEGTQTK